MRRAAAVVLGLALAACATDAPDTPSPYPPTVKPSPSTLVFGNTDTCETLRALFDRREGNEANLGALGHLGNSPAAQGAAVRQTAIGGLLHSPQVLRGQRDVRSSIAADQPGVDAGPPVWART